MQTDYIISCHYLVKDINRTWLAGCAVYTIGNNYYVVFNFAGTPISTEQLIEQSKPENLVPADGNENGSTTGFSTTGETLNPGDPNYDFINDIFERYIEEDNE